MLQMTLKSSNNLFKKSLLEILFVYIFKLLDFNVLGYKSLKYDLKIKSG